MLDSQKAQAVAKRLAIIEGQVRGIKRMVDAGDPCVAICTQIAAVQNALRGVGRTVIDNHMRTCVTSAIREGGQASDQHIDELLNIMTKLQK